MRILNKFIVECAHIFCNVDMQTSKVHMLIKMLPPLRHTTIFWRFGQDNILYTFNTRGVCRWYWVCRALFPQTIQSNLYLVQLIFQSFTFFLPKYTGKLHFFVIIFPPSSSRFKLLNTLEKDNAIRMLHLQPWVVPRRFEGRGGESLSGFEVDTAWAKGVLELGAAFSPT